MMDLDLDLTQAVFHAFHHFKEKLVQPLMIRLEQDNVLYDENGNIDADEMMRRLAWLRGWDMVSRNKSPNRPWLS